VEEDSVDHRSKWCVVAALLVAAPVNSKTLVVDQGGNGDYTTIQPAVDAATANPGQRDTVLVHAGTYPEILQLDDSFGGDVIVGTAGAEATKVLGVGRGSYRSDAWIVRGLTVVEACAFTAESHVYWEGCAFLGAFREDGGWGISPDLYDCDFYGPVSLAGYTTYWESLGMTGLRFHSAPLTLRLEHKDLVLGYCSFEGTSVDTLITEWTGDWYLYFKYCRFAGGAMGLHATGYGPLTVVGCTFESLGTAIYAPALPAYQYSGGCIGIDSSVFEHCGRGVFVRSEGSSEGWAGVGMSNCLVSRGLEAAIDVKEDPSALGTTMLGLVGNRFESCSGPVVAAAVGQAQVKNNVFFDNEGSALALTLTSTDRVSSIVGNTSALNRGDGISVTGDSGSLPGPLAIVRNITAQNSGDGIRLGAGFAGTLASNDSWKNGGGQYAGVTPGPTNLTIDPMFCDLAKGDLTVSYASPCAPTSSTGPMGALGVGCDQSLAGVPPSAAPIAFGARPSPARGSVEFTLPLGVAQGRVEVLDAQGRRVWSAGFSPGARALHWNGELEGGGRAGVGVYWARLAGVSASPTRRFVWLK
jgi:hypothetical protein